jgi:uncharacterized OB-fold protein
MPAKPVAEHLFDVVDGSAVLLGGKCRTCGAVAFPKPGGCARCTGEDVAEHRLATEGTLWTFTVQSLPLKPPYNGPAEFVPFGVGYANLGGEVLVEGRLTVNDPARLAIDMAVRVVPEVYTTDADGDEVVTYAFAPVEA